MRRKDREITDQAEMKPILSAAQVCRIGNADGSESCVVPVCSGNENGLLYFHSVHEGKKYGFRSYQV